MTNEKQSRTRTFRCDDATWDAAKAKAKDERVPLSTVIRELLSHWVSRK